MNVVFTTSFHLLLQLVLFPPSASIVFIVGTMLVTIAIFCASNFYDLSIPLWYKPGIVVDNSKNKINIRYILILALLLMYFFLRFY